MRYATKYARRWGFGLGVLFALPFLAIEPLIGVVVGAVLGTLSGLGVFWFLRGKERVWATLREPYEAEGIVHSGPAHCAIGPGYMMLTKNRLVWIPMAQYDRHKRIEIARTAFKQVRRASGLGTDLYIAVSTGESVEFLTRDRNAWIDHITRVANAA